MGIYGASRPGFSQPWGQFIGGSGWALPFAVPKTSPTYLVTNYITKVPPRLPIDLMKYSFLGSG
jgi:hypothetical protein